MASDDRIIFKSTRPDIPISDKPVTQFVFDGSEEYDDKVAIINGPDGASLTFKQVRVAINRAMNGLLAAGFKQGDVLGVHLPNIPQYAIIFHAAASLGGTLTTSNPTYNASELGHQLSLTGARFVITLPMFKANVEPAAAEAGVEKVWYLGEEPTFLQCEDDSPAPVATFDTKTHILAIPFSSGTSGLPKGVELTHASIVANLCQLTGDSEHKLDMGPDDCVLGLLPAFHIYGMVVLLQAALLVRARIVMVPKFDPAQFLTVIQEQKVTFLPIVPPIVLFLSKHPVVASFDLSSVRVVISGAAPLSPELTAICKERLGAPVGQGYGMTELSPASHLSFKVEGGEFVDGSCGRLLPNTEALLVDVDTGKSVGSGMENRGELWIRGPQVMNGYHKNPEATAATLDADGWLHTGDIASVNEEGDFFIVDRLKELIKVKGFQVAPAELEGLLQDHPAIADAAVIGIEDERAGEVPLAFVVLKPDQTATAEEIQSFIAEKVSAFKQIKHVRFTDAVPKSASGKILRRVLRAKLKEEAAAEGTEGKSDA